MGRGTCSGDGIMSSIVGHILNLFLHISVKQKPYMVYSNLTNIRLIDKSVLSGLWQMIL